jgi:hypothetical protein
VILSGGIGSLPIGSYGSVISNYFSMGCPHRQDSFFSAYPRASWVPAGSEPMVLWSAGCSSSVSSVGYAVYGLPKHSIKEMDIIRNYSCSQMMFEVVTALYDSIDVLVGIGHNKLERTE